MAVLFVASDRIHSLSADAHVTGERRELVLPLFESICRLSGFVVIRQFLANGNSTLSQYWQLKTGGVFCD
jgi:hypothetical protein